MDGEIVSFRWPMWCLFAVKKDKSYEPYVTQGDNFEFWVHVEPDQGRAYLCAEEFKIHRNKGNSLVENIVGTMSVPVHSLPELKKATEQLTMKTAGFIYNLKINEKSGVFEGVYVRWKNFYEFN